MSLTMIYCKSPNFHLGKLISRNIYGAKMMFCLLVMHLNIGGKYYKLLLVELVFLGKRLLINITKAVCFDDLNYNYIWPPPIVKNHK